MDFALFNNVLNHYRCFDTPGAKAHAITYKITGEQAALVDCRNSLFLGQGAVAMVHVPLADDSLGIAYAIKVGVNLAIVMEPSHRPFCFMHNFNKFLRNNQGQVFFIRSEKKHKTDGQISRHELEHALVYVWEVEFRRIIFREHFLKGRHIRAFIEPKF